MLIKRALNTSAEARVCKLVLQQKQQQRLSVHTRENHHRTYSQNHRLSREIEKRFYTVENSRLHHHTGNKMLQNNKFYVLSQIIVNRLNPTFKIDNDRVKAQCESPSKFSTNQVQHSSRPGPLPLNQSFTLPSDVWNGKAPLSERLLKSYQRLRFMVGGEKYLRATTTPRKRVVVLGTGWGSMSFLRSLNCVKFDVVVVSPRTYFAFTPLLPGACVGTLSLRSCMQPVREKMVCGGKKLVEFYEASAVDLDVEKKLLKCKSRSGFDFNLDYDYLVVSVGSETNTFNIPGVAENALFLKCVEDARVIHQKILDHLELAALPVVSEEQRKSLLHFVVVGGGPTGVETAAEIADFIRSEGAKHYPALMPFTKVTLVEMLPKILPMFSEEVSKFSIKNLQKLSIDTKMQCRVTGMTEDSISILDSNNQQHQLKSSFVIWASGVAPIPFTKTLLSRIPSQVAKNVLSVNEKLEVEGSDASIFAIGDCAMIKPEKLEKHVDWLYETANRSSNVPEICWIESQSSKLKAKFPQLSAVPKFSEDEKKTRLSKNEFLQIIKSIDSSFKSPPPTAQHAKQGGTYLASILNRYEGKLEKAPAYLYQWRGSMAYVGNHQSVIDSPWGAFLGGLHSHLMWKAFYLGEQMSFTNKAVCLFDWLKCAMGGRDVGSDRVLSCAALSKEQKEQNEQKEQKEQK